MELYAHVKHTQKTPNKPKTPHSHRCNYFHLFLQGTGIFSLFYLVGKGRWLAW